MATKTLTTSYLAQLTNANHDGVTQQIDDRFAEFETDNQMFIAARQAVHQARQGEDTAFKRFSGKDFASDDLKKEDGLEDKYMSTVHNVLNGLLYLPDTEPLRRKAEMAVQLFKDFNFSTSDGFEAEARKVLNMAQQWQAATDYTLAELGIDVWVGKAVVQAQKVLQLVARGGYTRRRNHLRGLVQRSTGGRHGDGTGIETAHRAQRAAAAVDGGL